jgi:hypothetical protein
MADLTGSKEESEKSGQPVQAAAPPTLHPNIHDTAENIAGASSTLALPLNWRGPGPRFHESVWGVVQKLTYLNALSRLELKRLLSDGHRKGTPAASGDANRFWRPWCDLTRLRALLPLGVGSWPRWFAAQTAGQWDCPEWPDQGLRYCARCLAQGFHSVLFQTFELKACPEHDEPLRVACPRCQERIPYGDLKSFVTAFECPCGALLWEARDEVARWYPPARFGRRLDLFARRLAQRARLNADAWQIRNVPRPEPGARLRLGPGVILAMPLRTHRLFSDDVVVLGHHTRERLPLDAVYRPIRLSLAGVCSLLVRHTLRYADSHLPAHRACLARPMAPPAEPPMLHSSECVFTNAVRLWRWQWAAPAKQRHLHELLLWHVTETLCELQNREILPRRAVPAVPQWWRLWALLAQRVLLKNFFEWLALAEHALAYCDQHQPSRPEQVHYPFEGIPFKPTMPMIWASPVSHAGQYLDIFHDGDSRLRTWNALRCDERAVERREGEYDEFNIRDGVERALARRDLEHPIEPHPKG